MIIYPVRWGGGETGPNLTNFKNTFIFHRLREFAKLYDTVRNERNKFVNLLHKAHQQVNEIRERHKMSLNELEILRNSAVTQER